MFTIIFLLFTSKLKISFYIYSHLHYLFSELHPQFSQRIQVNLTPINKTTAWRNHYRNKRINVRRAGLYNEPQKLDVPALGTQKHKAKIKRNNELNTDVETTRYASERNTDLSNNDNTVTYISDSSESETDTAETHKETELEKTLGISWDNKYNVRTLLEPRKTGYTRRKRVVKKVELAEIDEIRRINKTILTAQVSPISVDNQENDKTVVS